MPAEISGLSSSDIRSREISSSPASSDALIDARPRRSRRSSSCLPVRRSHHPIRHGLVRATFFSGQETLHDKFMERQKILFSNGAARRRRPNMVEGRQVILDLKHRLHRHTGFFPSRDRFDEWKGQRIARYVTFLSRILSGPKRTRVEKAVSTAWGKENAAIRTLNLGL
jgi:hypothetical protein